MSLFSLPSEELKGRGNIRSSRKQQAKFIDGENTHMHSKAHIERQKETEDSLQNGAGGCSDTEVQAPMDSRGL